MVLLPNYGSLIDEIRSEGFKVSDEIYMAFDGYNHYTMSKSLGAFMMSFTDTLKRLKPTWVILAGDRGEQLMAAIAASHVYIPVAHIQAGERSGNIDGLSRHAIGKFAHLHLAANEDAVNRLINLGEEPSRVHNVGAPQLDEIRDNLVTSPEKLKAQFEINVHEPFLLVALHPVTEEMSQAEEQVKCLSMALKKFDMPKVWIMPNNDAGSSITRRSLRQMRHSSTFLYDNLSREDYLGFMACARCMVGNSSSGLLEAPTFNLPAVNLGRRQQDRVRGDNVIDAPFDVKAIEEAIQLGCSQSFHDTLVDSESPYGDGKSASRILGLLEHTIIDDRLLIKSLTY